MKEQELILAYRRKEKEAWELGGKLTEMVNAFYAQGQIGCGLAFDAGRRIAELEQRIREDWHDRPVPLGAPLTPLPAPT